MFATPSKRTNTKFNIFVIIIGSTFLQAMRFDSAFSIISMTCTLLIATTIVYLRYSLSTKLIISLCILMISSFYMYQYVSPCKFTLCAPSSWEVQKQVARSQILAFGDDFVPLTVHAYKTDVTVYRTNDEPNIGITFDFIKRRDPPPADDAPYLYYSIDMNDRDPQRSYDSIPGEAWLDTIDIEQKERAFQSVRVSPRDALRQAQEVIGSYTQHTVSQSDLTAELLLATDVTATLHVPAVWEVQTRGSQDKKVIVWINASTGSYISHQLGSKAP